MLPLVPGVARSGRRDGTRSLQTGRTITSINDMLAEEFGRRPPPGAGWNTPAPATCRRRKSSPMMRGGQIPSPAPVPRSTWGGVGRRGCCPRAGGTLGRTGECDLLQEEHELFPDADPQRRVADAAARACRRRQGPEPGESSRAGSTRSRQCPPFRGVPYRAIRPPSPTAMRGLYAPTLELGCSIGWRRWPPAQVLRPAIGRDAGHSDAVLQGAPVSAGRCTSYSTPADRAARDHPRSGPDRRVLRIGRRWARSHRPVRRARSPRDEWIEPEELRSYTVQRLRRERYVAGDARSGPATRKSKRSSSSPDARSLP